jgi:ABC-type cobalamin transport system ATPase subunit
MDDLILSVGHGAICSSRAYDSVLNAQLFDEGIITPFMTVMTVRGLSRANKIAVPRAYLPSRMTSALSMEIWLGLALHSASGIVFTSYHVTNIKTTCRAVATHVYITY